MKKSLKMKEFLTLLFYERSSRYVVKIRALKALHLGFQHKLIFSLVKVLFN